MPGQAEAPDVQTDQARLPPPTHNQLGCFSKRRKQVPPQNTHAHTHLHKHTPQMTPQTHPHIYVISCLPPRPPFCNSTLFSFSTLSLFALAVQLDRRIYLTQTDINLHVAHHLTFGSVTKLNLKPLNLIILDGFKFSLNVWR